MCAALCVRMSHVGAHLMMSIAPYTRVLLAPFLTAWSFPSAPSSMRSPTGLLPRSLNGGHHRFLLAVPSMSPWVFMQGFRRADGNMDYRTKQLHTVILHRCVAGDLFRLCAVHTAGAGQD